MYEAAAVMAAYEPGWLPAAKVPDAEEERERVLRHSELAVGTEDTPQWCLERSVRVAVLRQLREEGRVAQALVSVASKTSPGDVQRMLEAYLRETAPPVAWQKLEEVTASHQVCQWLREAGFPNLPSDRELRQRADWFLLLEPCRHLVGKHFRGRTAELQILRDYVGVLPPGSLLETAKRALQQIFDLKTQPPLLLYGPGGVGKSTLLSRFLLDHAEALEQDRFPFIYLDFDRPDIDAHEPLSLLLEALRQLGIEYPESRTNCENLANSWRGQVEDDRHRDRQEVAARASVRRNRLQSSVIADFASLVSTIGAANRPVVLILDTFEEVQWRSETLVDAVWDLLEDLQGVLPRLRSVVAGRANLPDRETKELALTALDVEAAVGYLEFRGVKDPKIARRMVRQLGCSPMTLQLAADLYAKEGVNAKGELAVDTREYLFFKMDEAQIQRQLYKRVLKHVHNPEIKKLAHPGLVLRRITPRLILEVLAEPCGLAIDTLEDAEALFKELRREVSLVSPDGAGGLRHRTDLRRLMVDLLESDDCVKVVAIHGAAVLYYEKNGDTAVDRAEEIYHRLCLDEDFAEIAKRWIAGVERPLESALPEFSGARKAWLAARLHLPVDPETERLAELEDWERLTARKVKELLELDKPGEALPFLSERVERSPDSLLFLQEGIVLARLEQWKDSLAVLRRGFTSAAEHANRRLALTLSLQATEVALVGRQNDAAGQIFRDLIALHEGISTAHDRLRLLAHGAALQRMALLASLTDDLEEEWRQLFDALPDDQLASDSRLGLWIMVILGPADARRLARLIGIFGIPDSGERALRSLGHVLQGFARQVPVGNVVKELAAGSDWTTLEKGWSQPLATTRAALSGPLARLLDRFSDRVDAKLIDAFSLAARAALGLDSSEHSGGTARYASNPVAETLHLSGPHLQQLHELIVGSFTPEDFRMFLQFNFDRRLESLAAGGGSFSHVVFDCLQSADNEGWLKQLVAGLAEARPNREDVQTFASAVGVGVFTINTSRRLERIIRPSSIDLTEFSSRLGILGSQICWIEVDGSACGTGFLIGADLVLTANHLFPTTISYADAGRITLRFAKKYDSKGSILSRGTAFELSRHPFVATSSLKELDCRVLRVLDSPGIQPAGASIGAESSRLRGWVWLPDSRPQLSEKETYTLLSAPQGGALKLSTSHDFIAGVGEDRIWTRIQGEPGFSGALLLDERLDPIAMALQSDGDGIFSVPLYRVRQWLEALGAGVQLDPPPVA